MSLTDDNINTSTTLSDITQPIDHSIAFGVYLVIFVLSVSCYLFIFLEFIRKHVLRTKIQNHIVLAILICSFLQVIIELPIVLDYFHNNIVWIQSNTFCTIWCYIDYVFNAVILNLICYASIERYLLVFHRHFINRYIVLAHYIPITLCIIYPILFYFGVIIIYPCVSQYDYTKIACQGPCYLLDPIPGSIDLLGNLTIPLFTCILANIFLLVRVIHQKHRMRQQQKWKKNRHLVIQLMSIVIVHNLIWLPILICLLIILFSPIEQPILIELTLNLFTYSIYISIMLCPFVSLIGLPELWSRLIPNSFLLNRNPNIVLPVIHAPAVGITSIPLTTLSKRQHVQRKNNSHEESFTNHQSISMKQ